MMKFLLKGIVRDRSRSLFPFLIVLAGVFLSVALFCYIKGAETSVVTSNANLRHGHVKVMTRAYAKEIEQVPNDLALMNVSALIKDLQSAFPGFFWTRRILFGGLIDIPDDKGETRAQGPVSGMAADLLTPSSPEPKLLDLQKVLVRGRLPRKPGEILVSDELAEKLGVRPGEKATLLSTTMHGSMSQTNFVIAGTLRFGITAMDRTGIIIDLADIQYALDMVDAAGEILGFSQDLIYRQEKVDDIATAFNTRFKDPRDEFLPVMQTLKEQPGMDLMLGRLAFMTSIIVGIFLVAMSLVLWNAGLIGSLRRYGEIGVRLAIGEDKTHVYQSMIYESLMIGVLGTVAGTILGLALSYYLQVKGIDFSAMLKNMTFLMPTVLRSKVTPFAFVIGFIPGLLATFIGTAIAGIGIFKRQTAQLFKELET
jgi:putative ABC transport system permease protein